MGWDAAGKVRAFQHVAQRVLALDGTEAAGRGVIETTGWRIHTARRRSRGGACLRACWGADGLEAITGALSAFSGFCSNSTERGAAYGLSYVERVPFPRPVPFAVVRSHQKPSQTAPSL